MSNTKRIFKNTLMLYFRQILILFVSLYTVRIVLSTLGVEDYGIYSVVGGVVSFFSFLSGSMASATQRFFSFALGENNQEKLNKTFSTNLIIYFFIAIISVLLLEVFGSLFVYNRLKIPVERFSAAIFVFHFSVATFIFSIIASPFMAIIIAHEDMHLYAYVSIVEAILKLLVVFLLNFINWDKLKLYSCLLCFIGFTNAIIYLLICYFRYKECQFKKFYFDRSLLQETINFTGWTLFGQMTSVFRTQAVTILINQFFNPIVVASRTIATQVSNYINIFSSNFNTGIYPSIIKAYASKKYDEMFHLIFTGCKITFFLLWMIALPLFLEMDYVLKLWLKTPPEYAVMFTRLALIEVVISSVSMPLTTAARAPGKMKSYELLLGSVQLLIFVTDYILFCFFNAPAFVVFLIAAIGNFIMFFIRIILVRSLINLPIKRFFALVVCPILIVVVVSGTLSFFISQTFNNTFWGTFFSVIVCVGITVTIMFVFGLSKNEKRTILDKIKQKRKKNEYN